VHYPYYTNVYTENGGMAVDGTSDGNPRVVDGGLPQTSSVSTRDKRVCVNEVLGAFQGSKVGRCP
jgi:hypothetical protein